MKRSTAVILVLAGGTAAAALYVASKPRAENYPNVQACVKSERHSEQECEDAFAAAAREHENSAPHFQNRDQCIAAYGPNGCEERQGGGGSFFIPLMLGYVLGHGLGYHPLYQAPQGGGCLVGSSGRQYGQCYTGGSTHSGGFFGGGRSTGGSDAGSASSTVARGGFGSAGHGFGGGE